ncbi:odorant receptor 131-2-like [Chanos chanos]|uniref:Odorant receptor 131-2-like n=1 Tax=Chanos chanos TaxID=29144 RepID=A0A6J2VQ97_CHACN|nr:odorant receptor 131-2-like [Chanos chanos]
MPPKTRQDKGGELGLQLEPEPDGAPNLNSFYTRFDTINCTEQCKASLETLPITEPAYPVPFTVEDVCQQLSQCKPGKAPGPDSIQARVLKEDSDYSENSSDYQMQLVNVDPVRRTISMTLFHISVLPFIYINFLLFFVFCRREAFRSETRYILFAQTVLVDLIFLILTDFVVVLSYTFTLTPLLFCIPLCIMMEMASNCTPLTITAMCVERYVAICMPLRHDAISTTNRTMILILVIWILSSFNPFVDLFILTATSSQEYLSQITFCHYEIMTPQDWHRNMRGIFYFCTLVFTFAIEVYCFVMITLAAQAASGGNKKSASKGQRTLALHLLQLFLCSVEAICPYTEAFVIEIDFELFLTVRLFNFIVFGTISRAVSPLLYGLKDEKFYSALVQYTCCKMNHTSSEKEK